MKGIIQPLLAIGVAILALFTQPLPASAALNLVSLYPTNGAVNICPDTHLQITFDAVPAFTNLGRVTIYTAAGVPVDTNDLTLASSSSIAFIYQSRKIGPPTTATYEVYPIIVNGTTATIYPHTGTLTNNQTYYVNITSGLFTNPASGGYPGIADSTTWSFSTKPTRPPATTNFLVVAADNSGDFSTVQGALDFLPSANSQRVELFIRAGNYQEIIYVNGKNNLLFRGADRKSTIISYPNNNNLNTAGSSVRTMINVNASDIDMENLTLSNSTPHGGSQAEALRVSGARFILNNADLDSFQDTFLINSMGHYAYMFNSHIQGDTDFIWDDGSVVFQNCEIEAMNPGYNCQMRTSATTYYGAVFLDCSLTRAYAFTGHYLNRVDPNTGTGFPFSMAAYVNCKMDAHITPAGWLLNNLTATTTTNNLRFWEYESTDLNGNPLDVSQRIPPSLQVSAAQASLLRNLTNVLFGWLPQLAPNIIGQPAGQTAALGNGATFSVSATGIQTTNPATLGAPSILVPLGYQWFKNGTNPIAGATNSTLTINSVAHSDIAVYSVVVSNLAGVVTSSVAPLTVTGDSPPSATPVAYYRNAGYPLTIPISGLATNWSDPDGDLVSLTGVSNSTNGASVTYDATNLYYINTNDVTDQFTYSLSDGFGGTAVGVVTIFIVPGSANVTISSAVVDGNGGLAMNFAGVPGYLYWLEVATNLTAPVDWEPVATNTADTNGLWQFTDSSVTNFSQKFYRVVQP